MKKCVIVVSVLLGLGVLPWNAVWAEETDVKLAEVVVTATRTEKDPRDITQSVTVITGDEIRKSGATTTAEAVRRTAGVTIEEYGPRGAVADVTIRGSSSAQVLVLLDGKRLNSARSGGVSLSDLPISIDEIERIEIVRGPSSALYGADALGGVVNIITKKPEKSVTRATAAAGSHGYDDLSATHSGNREEFFYSASAGRETSDGFRTNSDLDQGTVGAKVGYEVTPDSSVELTTNYIGKEIGAPGSTSFPTPLARQWTRNTVSGLGYKTALSQDVALNLNAYRNQERLVYKNPDPLFPESSRHKGITNGADTQVNWLANSWNAITIGAEARRDSAASTDVGDHAASLRAGYFQDEIRIDKSFILVAGGRHDSHSIYGDKFSPKAGARYLFADTGTIIRASAGTAFRAPTFNDLYWPDTPFAAGNPNLKPETSKEYEASVEQPIGDGALKLTGFERKVKNLIDWQPDANWKYSPVNIGRARIRGTETEAKFKLSEPLTWAVNYTYMNPVDEVTGEKIYTIPAHQVKSYVNLALRSKTNIYLEGRMVKNYVKPSEDEWKYFTMDGKIMQNVAYGQNVKGDVFFGMRNVFDRKYETVKGYPMPPKEIYGGASVQF